MIIGTLCLLMGLLQLIVPSTDTDPICDPALFPGKTNHAACHQAWAARGMVSAACGIAGIAFMTGAVAAAVTRPRQQGAPQMPMARPPAAAPPPGHGPYAGPGGQPYQ
jgi:hypothetical protein